MSSDEESIVPCVACDETVYEHRAWRHYHDVSYRAESMRGFDYVCWECYQTICHRKRVGIESMVEEIESPGISPEEFIERYYKAVKEHELH